METQVFKVSIIIPAYNVSPYIEKCLKSIQKQTYKNIQIIIIDDMSTDNTMTLIKSMQAKDNRISLIQLEKNSGSAVARQKGIEASTGELITFVDADDWYCDNRALEKIVDVYQNTQVDCIMFSYNTVHKYGIVLPKPFKGKVGMYSVQEVAEAKSCSHLPHWHYLWNKCFKGDLLRSGVIRFHDELRCAEDVRFNSDFLRVAQNFYVMKSSIFYDYNCANVNQITRRKQLSSIENEVEQFERLKDEVVRLHNDYIAIGASIKAIEGLHINFLYSVYSVLYQNSIKQWYEELNQIIQNDVAFNEVLTQVGEKSRCIEKRVYRKSKLNHFKQYIKGKLKM